MAWLLALVRELWASADRAFRDAGLRSVKLAGLSLSPRISVFSRGSFFLGCERWRGLAPCGRVWRAAAALRGVRLRLRRPNTDEAAYCVGAGQRQQ